MFAIDCTPEAHFQAATFQLETPRYVGLIRKCTRLNSPGVYFLVKMFPIATEVSRSMHA